MKRLVLILATALIASVANAGATNFKGTLYVLDGYDIPAGATVATGDGDLYVEQDVEIDGTLTIASTFSLTGTLTVDDDIILDSAERIDNDTDGTVYLQGGGGTNNEAIGFDLETTANECSIVTSTGVTDFDFNAIDVISDTFEFTTTGETIDSAAGKICLNGVGGSNNEDVCFDMETAANTINIDSNTGVTDFDFNAIDVISDVFEFTTTAEFLDSAAGVVCVNGAGGSNNEDLCFDVETTANEVAITTNTGVTQVDFGAIAVVALRKNVAHGASVALTVNDCGAIIFNETDGGVYGLPDAAAGNLGCCFTVVDKCADTACGTQFSPHSSDGIDGSCVADAGAGVVEVVFSGTADKDIINTKGTSEKGDTATVCSDGAAGWFVTSCIGVWASE